MPDKMQGERYAPTPPNAETPCRFCGKPRTTHLGIREFCPPAPRETTRAAFIASKAASDRLAELERENAELREKGAALISACGGLEWSSFTEAGWKRVEDFRAALRGDREQGEG
jgi:hypothetical protein